MKTRSVPTKNLAEATTETFTPQQIDLLIADYECATADLVIVRERAQMLKDDLIALVDRFGSAPETAKKSKRWSGLIHTATITFSTTTTVNEAGVSKLRAFLESKNLLALFPRFFALILPAVYVPPPPRHRQLDGVNEVLKTLDAPLGKRIEEQLSALCGKAIDSKTNAPSLRIATRAA
jgi:hypothetical protein